MRRTEKVKNVILFAIYAAILGAMAGAAVWAFIRAMDIGTDLLWTKLPEHIGHSVIYTVAVCAAGGAVIGLFQKKFGIMPDPMEQVIFKLKRDGTYPHDKIHILVIGALLPLLFGGCLGPEAGLTGIITALCCWIGDRLKYKGAIVRELAEAAQAATLGVIFNAPFFGFVNNYEHPRNDVKHYFSPKEFKVAKTIVYISGIAGGMAAMIGLKKLLGGGSGLPRFTETVRPHLADWAWFPVLAGAGLACGIIYILLAKGLGMAAKPLAKRRVLSCIIGGLALAGLAALNHYSMFSGESQMTGMMSSWTAMGASALAAAAIFKMVAVNVCLSFGWRGGNIFPVIFSGVAAGYAAASFFGIMGLFAAAVVTATMCGYIMRKPLTVIAVLFLCFPLKLVIPLAAAAYIGSLVPVPWGKKQAMPVRKKGSDPDASGNNTK